MSRDNPKCDKCQKDNLEKLYHLDIISLRNPTDWIKEGYNIPPGSTSIEKHFCLDCWKEEEKNYRENSWDTFNWRNEPRADKRKKISQVVIIKKIPNSLREKNPAGFFIYSEPLYWNQPNNHWTFSDSYFPLNKQWSGEKINFTEEVDKDITINDSLNKKPFNWILVIILVIGAIALIGVTVYLLSKKKKKCLVSSGLENTWVLTGRPEV